MNRQSNGNLCQIKKKFYKCLYMNEYAYLVCWINANTFNKNNLECLRALETLEIYSNNNKENISNNNIHVWLINNFMFQDDVK